MYYLAADQEAQDLARAEVLSVLGDSPEEVIPTDGELKQMKYLDNCIKETMRINPPTSGNLPRIVTKDTYLGNFFVPKDTRVAIVSYTYKKKREKKKDTYIYFLGTLYCTPFESILGPTSNI